MTPITSFPNNFEAVNSRSTHTSVVSGRVGQGAFFGLLATLFLLSSTMTALWCNSMSAMEGMPMPGHWTMSMTWMRMPGQTWVSAAASFVGMWVMMMAAMMLPSLAPMLWRCMRPVGAGRETLPGRLATLVGLGYFFAWTLFGVAIFPVGTAAAAVEMEQPMLARAVPITAGLVVLIAGALQFTKWKARHLACCREAPGQDYLLPTQARAAWRLGLHLGRHCGLSCVNLTAILLVFGVMDLRVMVLVTAAITAERLTLAGKRVTRTIGALVVGAGLFLIVRAVGLG